jgi:uncharacterized protein (TIGR03437 family)
MAAAPALQAHLPSIVLENKYVNLVAAPGTAAAPQNVRLGTNEHPYQWTATAATARGGPWLSVSPDRGSFAGNFDSTTLRIAAASAGLAPGVYYGAITIQAPGTGTTFPADNTPQIIEVALTVTTSGQAAPGFAVAPAAIELEAVRGSGVNPSQNVQVRNVGGGTLAWTAAAATDNGGNWLTATPPSGTNAGLLLATATPGDLAVGVYTGRLTLSAEGAANSPQVVTVRLRVRDPQPPSLVLTPPSVTFSAVAGDPIPPTQTLVITNGGEGLLAWQVTATTFNGGTWLQASPPSGTGRGVLNLSADPRNLPPGSYAGRLTLTADGATNSPVQVPVTLNVARARPFFLRIGVVNAATFQPTGVAPGEIVSIFGARLGPAEGVVFTLDPETRRMPVTLGGVRVTFDGVPAPLFFVSEQQINLQVPFEVFGKTSARMVVNVEGFDPAEMSLEVIEAAPGLFTLDGTRAAALNQDFALNGPDNPAPVGSIVQLFLTGQGLLDAPVRTGELAPLAPPFPAPSLPVSVRIDSFEAPVRFVGLAPGFVGLTQLNVEVPRGVLPTNQARVVVAFGVYQAVKAATISVR